MEIEIEKLRKVTDLIFDHISQDLKIKSVPLEEDFYWNIPTEKVYDMDNTPTDVDVDVGQLYDDIEFAMKPLDDEDQAVSLLFVHIAPLLRYLGEKVEG